MLPFLMAFVSVTLAAQSARPDADSGVFVEARQTGQGLLRARGAECFVLTPNHVVEDAPITFKVRGSRASQADVEKARQLPGDMAILRVDKAGALPCAEWSSAEDLSKVLRGRNAGTLSMREASGSQTLMPVSFRAVDDEAIYVRPSQQGDQISKGMSGGALLVDGIVVGMLLSVEEGEGYVYQVDDIMRVSEGFFSPAAASAGNADLAGEYNFGGVVVKVQPSPTGLQYIQAGNPVHALVPAGERKFTSPTMPGVTAEFKMDEAGQVDLLSMKVAQVTGLGPRVQGPAPSATALAALVGKYSITSNITATLSLRDGKLVYSVSNAPKDLVLIPARDLHFTFEGNGFFSIRFHRDPSGSIGHFVLFVGDTTMVGTRQR